MTPKQRQLLDFIEAFTAQHRHPPSYEEMRRALGIAAKSGVSRLLDGLEEQGVIARAARRWRSIEVPGKTHLREASTAALLDELHRRGVRLAVQP